MAIYKRVWFRNVAMLLCISAVLAPQPCFAWGFHALITKVAVALLPAWQQEAIRAGRAGFERRYCVFPDDANAPDAAPYVLKFPAEQKISHHIPASLQHQTTLFEAYLPRVVELLKAQKVDEGMKYFGSLAHFLEDSSAPGHMAYGEARVPEDAPPMLQMDFFKRFLPKSDRLESEMVHSGIDGYPMTEERLSCMVKGHKPRLLGHSIEELVFQLAEDHGRMNERTCRHVFPMLAALGSGDDEAFGRHIAETSADAVRIVADVLYTVVCISEGRFESEPAEEVSLADRLPAKSTPFAWTDPNHQGRLIYNASGAVSDAMSHPPKLGRHPLSLKMADGAVRTFEKGFGVGWKTEYTFLLPKGRFKAFSVWVGNDAALGSETQNTYEVALDGKTVAKTEKMNGPAPARKLESPLGDAATITLRCLSDGPAKSTHGVWADPKLIR